MIKVRVKVRVRFRVKVRVRVRVLGNVFEAMMEKGQDQIPDEGFLMTKDKNSYVFYSYCR
jgi:hypothetical protein